MIKALHALIYSDDPPATRAFLRDVLGWAWVEDTGAEPGWLIFKSGPSEMGVHPTSGTHAGESFGSPRHHSISLVCDDVHATRAELAVKGAEFNGAVQDMGFGLAIMLKLPGADDLLLYQPRHPTAYDTETRSADGVS